LQKFQQLIHQAFAKIDASDPGKRQKVYENVWLMQEKSLIAQNAAAADKQEKRRHLTQLLKTIEKQYRAPAPGAVMAEPEQPPDLLPEMFSPAPPTDRPPKPAAEQAAPHHPAGRRQAAGRPEHDKDSDSSLYYLEQEVNRKVAAKPDEAAPSLLKKARSSHYIIAALAIFVALFVAWSFYNSFGLPGSARKHMALSTAPARQNNYNENGWVEIFNPANVAGLDVRGTAAADLHNEPDANFIRLTSYKADDTAIIETGQGALAALRGKTATFKLVARNADNGIGQLNLTADFGTGARVYYRFELSPTASALLFRLPVPQNLAGPARFYIGSDVKDKPGAIDIFSLLVRAADDNGH